MYIPTIGVVIAYIVLFIVATRLDDKIKDMERRIENLENKE